MKSAKSFAGTRRYAKQRTTIVAAAGAVLALSPTVRAAVQSFYWDPTLTVSMSGGGPSLTGEQWNSSSSADWFNPSSGTDVSWDSTDPTIAVFGGTFTPPATVTIASPVGGLNAAGLTFNTTGYTLSSSTANNTLNLTSPDGSSAPTISVATGDTATIGAFVSGGAGPNNLVLAGSAGLTVSGGGTLILGNAITLNGGITVNNSTLAEGIPAIGAGNTTFTYLNNNSLTLNGGSFTVDSTNSPFSTAQSIGAVTVSGNSTITMARGNTAASSSVLFSSGLTVQPNAIVNFSMAGNTSTTGAIIQFPSTVLNGPATFIDYESATQNAGGATAGAPFGENGRLGLYTDNGNNATFLSGGNQNLAGTTIRIVSTIAQGSTATGAWTLGNPSPTSLTTTGPTGPEGVSLDLNNASGSTGPLTTGAVTVNPWSQLWLDSTGAPINWGNSTQTITISGIGTVTPAAAATSTSGGAIEMGNATTGQLGNILASNISMAAASSISVGTSTINEIDGNITGTGPLTIVGGGTLNLGGAANDWTNGTVINSGSIVVNGVAGGAAFNSSLGSSNGKIGPLTLASSGTTSPTSTNLTLNIPNQTVQNLSATFAASSGTASNSIVLNGTNLNIIQTGSTSTVFGPGATPTLSSFITDGANAGSISLDATSTGTLTLSGANFYSGGTIINGGMLIVKNSVGSATGSGPVAVNAGTTLAGNGIISGTVTLNSGTLLPASSVGTPGVITFGGLTLNGGTINFNLITPGSSDQINLGTNGSLNLGAPGNTVTLNIEGVLDSGTFPLITYSSSAGSETGSFSNLKLGSTPSGFPTPVLHDDAGSVDLVISAPASLTWSGGSGSWDTVSQNWNNNTTTFSNTTTGSVIFDDTNPGTSPFTVTVAAGTSGGVTPGLVTFANNSSNYTVVSSSTAEIGGTPSGSGQGANATMVLSGTGTVTLQGPNSFSGLIAIDGGGTLSIAADNSLGYSGNNILMTSASTSQLSTLQATSTFTSARGVTFFSAGGAIDVTGTNTLTLSGVLSGAGGLTKTDTGTLILSSTTNSYSGPTTIANGFLQLGASGAMAPFSSTSIAAGATLNAQNFSNTAGSVSGPAGSSITIASSGVLNTGFDNTNTTFAGQITGAGSFGKAGSGTLTLTGSANTFSGGFPITDGGTVIGGTGGLGKGAITLSNGSTLQLSSSTTSFTFGGTGNPTLGTGTGGGNLLVPAAAAINLPTAAGANTLTIASTATASGNGATFISNSTTAGGSDNTTVGSSTDGGDTLEVGNTDTKGNIGLTDVTSTGAGGNVTLQSGSTFWQNSTSTSNPNGNYGMQIGFVSPPSGKPTNTLGAPASLAASNTINGATALGAATGIGTLTLNNNTTWKATGFNAYSAGSPTVGGAASININVPNSGDTLIDNTAWRTAVTNDTTQTINVTGNGYYQIASGAITTTMYAGSWNINMGSTGQFVIENITGGTGETLNALGYDGNTGQGWTGPTNPITASGGIIEFGADRDNPGDSTPPPNLTAFRSAMTIAGPTTIASTGYEYSNSTTLTTGAIFNTTTPTPVTANIAGDIEIDANQTLTVDTFDPNTLSSTLFSAITGAGTGPRSLNFTTNAPSATNGLPPVNGNFTWDANSTLAVNDINSSNATVTGGQVSFARTQGTITVGTGATLQIDSGATVNIGFNPSATGISGIDPLTDNSGGPINSVAVVDNGSIVWGGRTALTGDTLAADAQPGIKLYQVGGLTLGASATATLNTETAGSHSDRTLLVTPSINLASGSSLQINDNDMIVRAGISPSTTLASVVTPVLQGRGTGQWNGATGIISAAAAASPFNTAIAVVLNDTNGNGTGSPAFTTFDGETVSHNDVLVKYTYDGDALLTGSVTAADYAQIDNAFNIDSVNPGTLTGWFNGDFNYDGVINGDDYSLIDNAYNSQGSVSFAATSAGPDFGELSRTAEMIATDTAQIAGASSVPEPTSVALLTIGAAGLLSRRRRRT